MSTPDTPAVDHAWWRNLCDVAEADGNGPYVVVQTHTLRALLDAHEREAAKEPVAWMVEPVEGLSAFAVVGPPEVARAVSDAGDRITPLGPCGPTTTYEPEEGE